MTVRRSPVAVALAALALLVGLAGTARASNPPTVFAAASLTDVFPKIDPSARYSFAGSNTLTLQIRQGAPADVFASAAPNFTQELYRDGLVEKPRFLAFNRLTVIVPKSNPAGIKSVYDLTPQRDQAGGGQRAGPGGLVHPHRAPQPRHQQRAEERREPGVRREGRARQGRPGAGRRRLRLRHRRPRGGVAGHAGPDPGVRAAEGALRDRRGEVELRPGGGEGVRRQGDRPARPQADGRLRVPLPEAAEDQAGGGSR